MSGDFDPPASIKHVENDLEEWYEAEFKSLTDAQVIRNSETVKLHRSDDKRQKTVRLQLANSKETLQQISKKAIDQPEIPDEW